jgi:hypothetical protein
MFGVTSDPLPMSDRLFSLIGEIVIHWTRVEAALLQDTSSMFRHRIVQDLATEPPRSFKKKLELWRRATRKLYAVPAYQDLATTICTRAKAASKLRNHLMHGVWSLEEREGAFTVSSVSALRHIEQWDSVQVSENLLEALLQEIKDVDRLLMGLIVSKMLHAYVGQLRENPSPSAEHQALQGPPTRSKVK